MTDNTTVRLSKDTVAQLRSIIQDRKRKESIEQIVIELIEAYNRLKGLDK